MTEEDKNLVLLDVVVEVPKHVAHRVFAGETVVLNLQTGRYHGLNPTGGRIFELLSKATTVREVAAALAQQYDRPPEQLERHRCDFCADLIQQGLIEANGSVPTQRD